VNISPTRGQLLFLTIHQLLSFSPTSMHGSNEVWLIRLKLPATQQIQNQSLITTACNLERYFTSQSIAHYGFRPRLLWTAKIQVTEPFSSPKNPGLWGLRNLGFRFDNLTVNHVSRALAAHFCTVYHQNIKFSFFPFCLHYIL